MLTRLFLLGAAASLASCGGSGTSAPSSGGGDGGPIQQPASQPSPTPSPTPPPAEDRPPNVIVILTDDLGYGDVGFNGSTEIPTPNIDRIANEGVRFDQAYVSFPVCGPSRAGLLTGRYQSRFGYDLNASQNPLDGNAGLPLSEITIADVLDSSGYTTAIVGKWHMGNHPRFHPFRRGFDEFYGFTNGGHGYFLDDLKPIAVADAKDGTELYTSWLFEGRTQVETSGYLTDWLSDKAVDFVEREKDRPFFLYLAYNAPHIPMQATQEYLDRFSHIDDNLRRTYAAMVSAVDDGVGDVLDKIDEHGLAENTIVFFLSDNGGPVGRISNGASNGMLREGKNHIFEGGVRVPFAVRWTNTVPAGIDYRDPISSLDIMATVVGINNIDTSTLNPLDGVNLVPFLRGEVTDRAPHNYLFWRMPFPSRDNTQISRYGVVSGSAKLVDYGKVTALFDLSSDIGENSNLTSSNPELATELDEKWREWNAQMATQSAIPIYNEW